MTRRLIRRFTAYDPERQPQTLYEYAEVDLKNEGLPELRTAEGRAVNLLGPGRYQVVTTGVLLNEH
jgi:hypothetical protein